MYPYSELRGRRGFLRPYIINSLKSSPKNGAEIMSELEIMSKGYWRPSPGSVYPILHSLENEGVIKKRENGKYEMVKNYESVETQLLDDDLESIINEMRDFSEYLLDLAQTKREKLKSRADDLKMISERLQTCIKRLEGE
ncbi:MAG: PadR family transcriptional regulator [Thermoplasmataceae archaeon]|jgi:DNA-binding PadR family transcriptional regulator